MKKIFLFVVLIIFENIFASNVHAEVRTYIGVGESIISDRETLEIGKQGAKLQAIRNAQEQAGVFISSLTEVKNNILQKDEIIAFTSGIAKIEDDKITYEVIPINDFLGTIKYRSTVVVKIDTDDLNKQVIDWISRNADEHKKLVSQNKLLLENIEDLKKRNAELEKRILKVNSTQKNEKINQDIKTIENNSTYTQKLYDGYQSYYKKDYESATKNYGDALKLKLFESEGNGFPPNNTTGIIKRLIAESAAIAFAKKNLAEYVLEYIKDRIGDSDYENNYKVINKFVNEAVNNSVIIKKEFVNNEYYRVTMKLRNEDVDEIEKILIKYN